MPFSKFSSFGSTINHIIHNIYYLVETLTLFLDFANFDISFDLPSGTNIYTAGSFGLPKYGLSQI